MATEWTTIRQCSGAGTEGTSDTYALVAAVGNCFKNNGKRFVHIVNSSGANSYTISIPTPATVEGYAVAEVTVAVAISKDFVIGPFNPRVFNSADGMVTLTYVGTPGNVPATDLRAAVFEL